MTALQNPRDEGVLRVSVQGGSSQRSPGTLFSNCVGLPLSWVLRGCRLMGGALPWGSPNCWCHGRSPQGARSGVHLGHLRWRGWGRKRGRGDLVIILGLHVTQSQGSRPSGGLSGRWLAQPPAPTLTGLRPARLPPPLCPPHTHTQQRQRQNARATLLRKSLPSGLHGSSFHPEVQCLSRGPLVQPLRWTEGERRPGRVTRCVQNHTVH